jgi:hypothetical protein
LFLPNHETEPKNEKWNNESNLLVNRTLTKREKDNATRETHKKGVKPPTES